MINLLNPTDKKRLRAARRNSLWVRYNLIIIAVIVAVNIVLVGSIYMLYLDKVRTSEQVDDAKNKQSAQYAKSVKTKAESFKEDLTVAKTLLDADISYSDIITTIANAVPESCSIKTLDVDSTIYSDTVRTMDFYCDNTNNTTAFNNVSSFLTEIERSLVFTSVYVQKLDSASEKGKNVISTTLKIQDPAKKIPLAIPAGCKLRTISALGNNEADRYLTLSCRPSKDMSKEKKTKDEIKDEVESAVEKKLLSSCYFGNDEGSIIPQPATYAFYKDNYYVADLTYRFISLDVNSKPIKKDGVEKCQ